MSNGTGVMQNGNRKLISLCVVITVAINTPTLFILKEHWERLTTIESNRYTDMDAMRDRELIFFRFERNEAHIQECLDHIREARK